MSSSEFHNVQAHEGRPVGVEVMVEFPPDEAERLTRLAEEAGVTLAEYVRRLVGDAAVARSR